MAFRNALVLFLLRPESTIMVLSNVRATKEDISCLIVNSRSDGV